MRDELKRNLYVKHLAGKYGLYESVLFRELERQAAEKSRAPSVPGPVPAPETGVQPVAAAREAGPMPAAERDLLKVMLEQGEELTEEVFNEISPADFSHPVARATALLLGSRRGSPPDIHELLTGIQDEEVRRFVTEAMLTRYEISSGWEAMGSGVDEPDPRLIMRVCLDSIRSRNLDDQLAVEFRALKSAEERGEPLGAFQQRIRELQERKKLLRARPSPQQEDPQSGE
jgi:hypothetical protein